MSEPVHVTDKTSQPPAEDAGTSAAGKTAGGAARGMAGNGRLLAAIVGIYCLAVALVFYETLNSIVAIWIRSETFAHGFLILPMSLWLAWQMRDRFAELTVRPAPWALVFVLGAGMAWLFANLVDVLVVQQLALVAILITGIWAIVGTAVVRRYAFPLGFLFLAVPMGENLIPPLMVLTADTTEFLVRASGVPIYREGMYLYLPTGTWSVIEACSGVRYLIASVTLGLFYAHLTYHTLRRQLVFMAVAIVLPIVTNSVRAYILVMVGHLSDMRYGVGADHIVFGWVLFGVVMLLMFWIGGFWVENKNTRASDTTPGGQRQNTSTLSIAMVAVLAIVSASAWQVVAQSTTRNSNLADNANLTVPAPAASWQTEDQRDLLWRPAQQGADRELDQMYAALTQPDTSDMLLSAEPALVGLHLRQYLRQQQGAELVETVNPWRPDRREWRLVDQQRIQGISDQNLQVEEALLMSAQGNMLIWSWYHIDNRNTSNPYLVKILEAKQQILEGRRQGTRVFVATATSDDRSQARQLLETFITDHLAAIETTLAGGIAPLPGVVSGKQAVPVSEGLAE